MWKDLLISSPSPSVCWVSCLKAVWTPGKFTLTVSFSMGSDYSLKCSGSRKTVSTSLFVIRYFLLALKSSSTIYMTS